MDGWILLSTVRLNSARTLSSHFVKASYSPVSFSWRLCTVKDQSERFKPIFSLKWGATPSKCASNSFLPNRRHTTCEWFPRLMLRRIDFPFNPYRFSWHLAAKFEGMKHNLSLNHLFHDDSWSLVSSYSHSETM